MIWRKAIWLAVFVVPLLISLLAWHVLFPGRPFDRTEWAADERGSAARQAMADRLLAQATLIGRTRAEVVELLGEPPPTESSSGWDLIYCVGPERGFISIDYEWLVLRLDSNGRVSQARLITD